MSIKFKEETAGLELRGLRVAPAQVMGSIRLIPLLRPEAPGDLRLHARPIGAVAAVGLAGAAADPDLVYYGYLPHAMIVDWSADGTPVVSHGAALGRRSQLRRSPRLPLLHRMAKREGPDRLRLLPLHLAFEAYLSLHFGGPDVAWREYTRQALRDGLSPRREEVTRGAAVGGLAEALRTFEIHDDQVGVIVLVAEALAAIDVVPHPEDYRALHRTLIEDLYGDLIVLYGAAGYPLTSLSALQTPLERGTYRSLEELGAAVSAMRAEWAATTALVARGVLSRPLRWQDVGRRLGPFRLRRFIGRLDPNDENHIGEAIVRDDGTVEYLKTFRLSAAQVRRAYLLEQLAAHAWSLAATAAALGTDRRELIARIDRAGFGFLLRASAGSM